MIFFFLDTKPWPAPQEGQEGQEGAFIASCSPRGLAGGLKGFAGCVLVFEVC